jgi:hypothetical protein
MPGSITVVSGLIERQLGRGVVASSALQRIGKGGTFANGGGQILLDLSVAGVGNGADSTEDTLFTHALPANTLDVVGRCITLLAWGSVPATSATKTARVYFGAISASAGYTTTQTGNWQIYMMIWKQANNVQLALSEVDAIGATTARQVTPVTNGAETDTAAITVKVTGQSSAATANLVLCNGFQVCGYN